MKIKILFALAAVLTLGLGVVVFAYTSGNAASARTAVAADCCKGDSCPMKKSSAATADAKESCDCSCDCCKGDSCPMKKAAAAAADGTHSCPMMKDAAHAGVKHASDAKGEHNCSCGCSCCGGAKDKKASTDA